MRILASGLIVFSCGSMGFIVASSYSKRVQNLRQLISFIQVLESEIQFAHTTLPQVITSQISQFSGQVGRFLTILSQGLETNTGERFSIIWEQGVLNLAENGLPKPVLEDLRSLGTVLGISDVSEQIKHLQQLLRRLEQALQLAEEEKEKHTRLWQYLGFSAGLLLVLLLV